MLDADIDSVEVLIDELGLTDDELTPEDVAAMDAVLAACDDDPDDDDEDDDDDDDDDDEDLDEDDLDDDDWDDED